MHIISKHRHIGDFRLDEEVKVTQWQITLFLMDDHLKLTKDTTTIQLHITTPISLSNTVPAKLKCLMVMG